MANGHFVYHYLLMIAFGALDFGSHFMLKYPDDCQQLRNLPQDG